MPLFKSNWVDLMTIHWCRGVVIAGIYVSGLWVLMARGSGPRRDTVMSFGKALIYILSLSTQVNKWVPGRKKFLEYFSVLLCQFSYSWGNSDDNYIPCIKRCIKWTYYYWVMIRVFFFLGGGWVGAKNHLNKRKKTSKQTRKQNSIYVAVYVRSSHMLVSIMVEVNTTPHAPKYIE